MTLRDQILAVIAAYCVGADVDTARASQRSLGDRRLLVRVEVGLSSLTVDRAEGALAWFSAHWPEGAAWPEGVPRPGPSPEAVP